ncbi:MAG: SDR family NAD(P)-dependent oxidoreductase [Candidatus Dormibacteria bacterium]
MGRLDGRVAIVTGAGRGLGRCHALLLASEGAAVLVNDLGGDVHGEGSDATPAQETVAAIQAAGGTAAVSGHDVADWEQAEAMVQLAIDTFGDLHVLVNNAGILRDKTLANMTEQEWDAVVRVHLKGHAAPTRHACAYWRERSRAGLEVRASVIHTSSASGLVGNFGQANYGAAKMAVVALSKIVSLEMGRYGVRSNVIAPAAVTRMGASVPAGEELPQDVADRLDPSHVSPLVAWLATVDCRADNQVFQVHGDTIILLQVPHVAHEIRTNTRWTLDELDDRLPALLVRQLQVGDLIPEGETV